MSNRTITKALIATTVLLCLFATQASGSMSHRKHFRAGKDRATKVVFNEMEIKVPAGAEEEELSVEWGDPDLDGIKKPYGFKAVGRPYRFGPHGKKFAQGKPLKVKIKYDRNNLTGTEQSRNIRLFYINREKMRLEEVKHKYDLNTGILTADIPHFSDYIPGITPGWDGNGINPFFDITHGEETVSVTTLKLSVRSTVLSLPGRGLNFNLIRASSDYPIDVLKISDNWYWDLPYVEYGYINAPKINIPGKGGFILGEGDSNGGVYNICGAYYKIISSSAYDDSSTIVCFSDGTQVENNSNFVQVTDPNGNWYRYRFQHIGDSESGPEYDRLGSLTDSMGRVFNFGYDSNGILTQVTQTLKNGQKKTILTRSYKNYTESFTDALGRKTSYSDGKITYPNGARSEYTTGGGKLSQQRFYQPNQTQPTRVVNYSSYYGILNTVNDGIKVKKYDIKYYSYSNFEPFPYISKKYTYTTSGQLLEQKDFTYQPDRYDWDMITSVATKRATPSGALGQPATYQYEYDNWGNITRVIDPNGAETRMAYANTNSQKNLSVYNPLYQNSKYTANFPKGWNRPVTKGTLVKDSVRGTTQLKQTHYQYDTKGNLIKESEVHGSNLLNTSYTYDSYGNILTKTDANGKKLGFEYSSAFKNAYLTRVYKPDTGQTIATFDYDWDTGNKIKATDPKGNIYRYQYDSIGRLTKEWLENSNPKIGVAREIGYNDAQSLVTLKYGGYTNGTWQPGYQQGRIWFDPLFGKPQKIERLANTGWATLKQNSYDTAGRLITETDGMGHTTTHNYDELNRKIRTRLPDGAVTKWEWNDRILTITDANQNKKVQTYDKLNRLTKVQEYPQSGVTYTTSYTYDNYDDPDTQKTDSRLLRVTNPKGAATTYTYDNLGRLLQVNYPQDGANPMAPEIFTYDNAGNLKTKTTAKGTKTLDYEYWAGYRLKKVTEPDGRVVSYTYDANDNPLTQSAPGATYSYTYDARNRLTGMTAVLDGFNFNFGYSYDVLGRVTSINYPGRTNPVSYTYDALDRLQTIPGFVSSCKYDLDNKLLEMVYTNGIANNFTYDKNDRPTKISAGGGSLLNLNYYYDPMGNVTQINNDYYGYDGLNRLTWCGNQPKEQLAVANGTIWSYDGAGNMAGKTAYCNGVSQGLTAFNYDLANRLWLMGTTNYDNDAAGARIGKMSGDSWTYRYDGESRLTQVVKNGINQVDCAYDGNGMRVKKAEGGKTTYYVYNGPNPLMEYSTTDGKYMYRIYAGKKAVAEEKDGVVKFYHKDHLGSTRVVTDITGTKVAEYKFAPYGEKELSSGDGTEYGFTDKVEDVTTGLKYFGARFYDPEVGRFITVDPKASSFKLEIPQSENRYSYCWNNPIKYIDPNGKDVWIEGPNGIEPAGHQSICVGDPNGYYDSYSFGVNGNVNWFNGLEGEVYKDTVSGGKIDPNSYLKTTTKEDAKVKSYLEGKLGEKGAYHFASTCRTFSQKMFKFFEDKFGKKEAPPERKKAEDEQPSKVPASSSTVTSTEPQSPVSSSTEEKDEPANDIGW